MNVANQQIIASSADDVANVLQLADVIRVNVERVARKFGEEYFVVGVGDPPLTVGSQRGHFGCGGQRPAACCKSSLYDVGNPVGI